MRRCPFQGSLLRLRPARRARRQSGARSRGYTVSTVREIRRAVIVMVLLVILWGYSWITAKIGLNYASPMDVVALRLERGILTLFIPFILTGRPIKPQPWQAFLIIRLIQTG